jgi:hypothetical protein
LDGNLSPRKQTSKEIFIWEAPTDDRVDHRITNSPILGKIDRNSQCLSETLAVNTRNQYSSTIQTFKETMQQMQGKSQRVVTRKP